MPIYEPKLLKRTEFGDPILQQKAEQLSVEAIKSRRIKELIADIRHTLLNKKFGVGLAAPQVGESLALSVISIRPTPARPDREHFDSVIINPAYKGVGEREPMWEGCLSMGTRTSPIFAQAERYAKIQATWLDENGKEHSEVLSGLPAHVFQHETDHLNGILFPQRVKDHTTWMNASEYKKRIVAKQK